MRYASSMPVGPKRTIKIPSRAPALSLILPIIACAYAGIIDPLLALYTKSEIGADHVVTSRLENRIFWPTMAIVSLIFVLQHRVRLTGIRLPAHILLLVAYLAVAALSVLWASSPAISFTRYTQQVMIVASVILPALVAPRPTDVMHGLFVCFAFGLIINLGFVLSSSPLIVNDEIFGYTGFFTDKNTMGEFVSVAFLLALHEAFYSGRRRALGIIVAILAIYTLHLSKSKTSLGFALVAPAFVWLMMLVTKNKLRSLSAIILLIPALIAIGHTLSDHVSMHTFCGRLYGDPSCTNRSVIWDFVVSEIQRKPLQGYGYQSFWLTGPDAPSVVDAPPESFIRDMPHAHNGYYDTILDTGYIGFSILAAFIITTMLSIVRFTPGEPLLRWLLLSLSLLVILTNLFETLWFHGYSFLWIIFLTVAAQVARFRAPRRLLARHRPSQTAPRLRRPILQRSNTLRPLRY